MKKVFITLFVAAFLSIAGNIFAEAEKSATTAPAKNAAPTTSAAAPTDEPADAPVAEASAKKSRSSMKDFNKLGDLTKEQKKQIAEIDSQLQKDVAATKTRMAKRTAIRQAMEKVRTEVLTEDQRKRFDVMKGRAQPENQPAQGEN